MSREAHVRICESVRVKFPRATRPFTAAVDLGFGFTTVQTLRLRGLDAPEIQSTSGREAKEFLDKKFTGAKRVLIKTVKSDKYDRYLADLFVDGDYVNQELVEKGLAAAVSG